MAYLVKEESALAVHGCLCPVEQAHVLACAGGFLGPGTQPVGLPFGQGLIWVRAVGLAGFDAAHGPLAEVDVAPREREQLSRSQAKVGLEDESVYCVSFGDSFRVVPFKRGDEIAHFLGREDAVSVQSCADGVCDGRVCGACGVEWGQVNGVGCELEGDA